ncbi:hypothetical protein CPB83DRAFT_846461 [Crepidotus variabilis]|uniref:SET domain-containing protein n=1 Tax=Crepidotus variabilis TaxID=179855 RepID=A0A9P6EPZ5_9AGAR|nr:hypothetical protein CPB83DRAFT_846461 [Crepidotus variabilis]
MIKRTFRSKNINKGLQSPLTSTSSSSPSSSPVVREKQASTKSFSVIPSLGRSVSSRTRAPNATLNTSSSDSSITNGSVKGHLIISDIPNSNDGDGMAHVVLADSIRFNLLGATGIPSRIPKQGRILHDIKPTSQMGLGVFSNCHLKRGDLIFCERPLLVVPSVLPGILIKRPDNVKFTPQQEARAYMMEFELLLSTVFKRMGEGDQAAYRSLGNCHQYGEDGVGPLYGIFRTNAFNLDEFQDTAVPQSLQQHSVVCRIGSRINHSCMPNVGVEFDARSFSVRFKAIRNIEAGEQLFCSYVNVAKDFARRQTVLYPYGITCHCRACLEAKPESDRVRTSFIGKIQAYTEFMSLQPSTAKDTKRLHVSLSEMLKLENAMVKEGIDGHSLFEGLLVAICCTFAKLGNKPRAREYYRNNIDTFERRSDAKTWKAWYELM